MIKLFIDGGGMMWPILGFFVFGIAICIERLWTLSRASINTRSFLS